MKEFKAHSLKPYNTFGLESIASQMVILDSVEEIEQLSHIIPANSRLLILGGGSNVLFTSNFDGTVVAPWFTGIDIIEDKEDTVLVKAAAGEDWDNLVSWACERNLWGIENLSLIPGKVGACPIQNIGAYGVEVKDTIERVNYYNLESKTFATIANDSCRFGYRNSIFKQELKNKIIVTSVEFRLSKVPKPVLHYANLQDLLNASPTPMAIRKVVIEIRESKLPDPKVAGNAGSFFKNPVIQETYYNKLKETHPEIPSYPGDSGTVKVPAGWLIEKAGWKGKTVGNAGVHAKQALVIINHGNATGSEIIGLAKEVQHSVLAQFGIELEMEVNAI
jgi:UDP-N-acetylmuramate dehydrogenase